MTEPALKQLPNNVALIRIEDLAALGHNTTCVVWDGVVLHIALWDKHARRFYVRSTGCSFPVPVVSRVWLFKQENPV